MVIGIDFGFGHIKYALGLKDGSMELGKIPSIIAIESDDGESSPTQDSDIFHYKGKNYCVGDLCSYYGNKSDIEKYEDLQKYAPLFLASILKKLKAKSKNIETLVVCLAPIHYEFKDEFIETIKSFSINGDKYSFENIVVLQQCACSKEVVEKMRDKEDTSDKFMIVDIGFNTLDVCIVLDGKIRETNLKKNSVENYGVIKMASYVLNEASRIINTRNIGIKDAMGIIVTKEMKFRGNTYDFSDIVEKAQEDYFQIIYHYLESNYETFLDRLEAIYLIGGGSYYVKSYEKHFKKFSDKAEYFNAIGCFLEGKKISEKNKMGIKDKE